MPNVIHHSSLVTQPLQRDTLEAQIFQSLRTAILERAYKGGERLTQEDLAKAFGTSRIPVRDALKRLAANGLLVSGDNGGFHVVTFGSEDVVEVYALRAHNEAYAALLAAPKLSDDTIKHLAELTYAMTAAAENRDFEAYTRHNTAFHFELYEAAAMPRLLRIIEGLWVGRPPLTPIQVPGQVEQSLREHREMLEALRQRDGVALADLVTQHIEHARDALLTHYGRLEDPNMTVRES